MKMNPADRPNESEMVAQAISRFPKEFGLKSWPNKVFRLSQSASYISDNRVMLYTVSLVDGEWQSFCKCTEQELNNQLVKI